MAMQMLRRLARAAVRYGLKPEDIGPISTFTNEDYMVKYLDNMKRWNTPSFYGCTAKHQERARRAWDKMIAKVEAARDMQSSKATKPVSEKKARRRATVGQPPPVGGKRPAKREPEDGFDLAILSPRETGLPFVVYILEDMGVVPDVRVEVERSARVRRSQTVKVAIRPTARVTSGHLAAQELALLTRWVELNRNVLIKYWDGEIESTMDAIQALKPISPST
jgi:hypothetical protein